MPEAPTCKVTLLPEITVWLSGWSVIDGGTTKSSVATALVAEPARLVTTRV